MEILTCVCGGFIKFDTGSYFSNGDYSGVCEDCGRDHRAPHLLVDAVVWDYKGEEA